MNNTHGKLKTKRWCLWMAAAKVGCTLFMNTSSAEPVATYSLRLRGLRVQGHLGVSDAERATPQALNVAVDVDLSGAAYPTADDLAGAVNYAEIARVAEESAQERPARLLETFALCVARRLMARWPAAERVRVAVTKVVVPMLPPTDEATVEVTLARGLA